MIQTSKRSHLPNKILSKLLFEIQTMKQYKSVNTFLDIAIVDDDPEMVTLIQKYLNNHINCNIYGSTSAQGFFEVVNNHKIDLCIIDIFLKKNLDGFNLAELTQKSAHFSAPIIFISSKDCSGLIPAHSLKNVSFLKKPFTSTDLAGEIKKVV